MALFSKAKKTGLKIRVALIGPSGSGKTFSALRIATGIGGRVGLLDTECGRAKYYADEFDFDYIQMEAPFKPERYIEVIKAAAIEGLDTLIIDTTSHEWSGKGGILEENSAMGGNSYTNWNKLTPRHNAFIDAIIQSPINIIATLRGKDEYVLTEKNGKQTPQKVGMGAVMRDGFEYEMTCSFMINQESHAADVMKDNTHIFTGCEVLTEEHGKRLKAWANGSVNDRLTESQIIEAIALIDSFSLDQKDILAGLKREKFTDLPADRFDKLIDFITNKGEEKKNHESN